MDLPPGQGLGGAVGGNLLDTTLKATLNSDWPVLNLPALPPSLRFSRGRVPALARRPVRAQRALIRLAACTRVGARRNMMEEKKSEYRATQSLQDSSVSPKKKGPVHTSMKIEPKSSRDRHVELAAAVGVKSPQPSRPPESVRLSTAGSDRAAEEQAAVQQRLLPPGDEEQEASAQAPGGAEIQNAKATGNAEERESKPDRVATEASSQETAQHEASIEEQVASIFGELIENSVKTCDVRETKRLQGTGTDVRVEMVAFAARKPKRAGQQDSAISTLLRLTGLSGRADGQFSCMAGVALGPSGLFFIGDSDNPNDQDLSHLENLRMQDSTPDITAKSEILTVLHASEKEKVESWRRAALPLDGQLPGSPRSPITATRVLSAASRRASPPLRAESALMETEGGLKTVKVASLAREHCYTPETTWQVEGEQVSPQPIPVNVPVRCWGLTFVADVEKHCIQVLRADGKHIRRFGSFGKEPGKFNALQGIVVDREVTEEGERVIIYVADTYNHRIQVLQVQSPDASDLRFVRCIGDFGKENGFFNYPVGLTLDRETNSLIVADTGNDRIQILSTDGEHRKTFGLLGKHETNAEGIPLFKLPHDVVVIARKIYVTDLGNHRIQVLTMDGQHVRSLGSQGTKTGMFVNPRRLMQGPAGLLLVSDQENNRVQILSADNDLEDTTFTWRRLR